MLSAKTFDINDNEENREIMKEFWVKHSTKGTIQEMMLDSNAEIISEQDMPEVLSHLPDYKNQIILELGAGIGRFTRVLAQDAKQVVAVDFIESFIEKNKELNKDLDNIEYTVADATKLSYAKDTFDMIFTNWLLMYIKDDEMVKLIENSLNILKADGFIYIRESCFHSSGNIKNISSNNENPTLYRTPTNYLDFFQSVTISENGVLYGYELIFARPNRAYIEMKNNGNQIQILFQKKKLANYKGYKTATEFFAHKQYTMKSILRYEQIYGNGFITTGGAEQCQVFFDKLNLKENMKVLDVGCAIGGADFLMSQKYGAEVFGVDLRSNLIDIGWERLTEMKKNNPNLKVRFEIGDISKFSYSPEYFDVIYTTDTMLHIENKKDLFKKFEYWLKPGGKIFCTDYCCGAKPWSEEFKAYVEERGYDLLSVQEYDDLLKETGFVNIESKDETETFIKYSIKESEHLRSIKSQFLLEFTIEDYDLLLSSWKEKITRSKEGFHRWGIMYAEKKKQ